MSFRTTTSFWISLLNISSDNAIKLRCHLKKHQNFSSFVFFFDFFSDGVETVFPSLNFLTHKIPPPPLISQQSPSTLSPSESAVSWRRWATIRPATARPVPRKRTISSSGCRPSWALLAPRMQVACFTSTSSSHRTTPSSLPRYGVLVFLCVWGLSWGCFFFVSFLLLLFHWGVVIDHDEDTDLSLQHQQSREDLSRYFEEQLVPCSHHLESSPLHLLVAEWPKPKYFSTSCPWILPLIWIPIQRGPSCCWYRWSVGERPWEARSDCSWMDQEVCTLKGLERRVDGSVWNIYERQQQQQRLPKNDLALYTPFIRTINR